MAEEGTAAAQEAAAQQQFVTQRIYTKDISFESPMTPNVFRQEWKPAVNVDLNTKSSRVDEEGNHEVVLTLTITAKLEEQTAFLVEVQQAGIFFVAGIEGDALRQLLSTVAPTILFPYAREAVDNLVVKGGFPALMIAPVNFDALFRQAVAQQATEAGDTGEGGEAAPRAPLTDSLATAQVAGKSRSLSLRVRVFLPHPSSSAASALRPPVCRSAASIMIDSNRGNA